MIGDEVNIELLAIKNVEKIGNTDKDYLAKCIGEFGVWQAGACAIASLTRIISMWNMLSIIFLTPATNFKCVKFENNVTVDVENSTCYHNCERYEFYKDIFDETLISEFGLVCDDAWKATLSQTILMFGLLLGVYFFGWLSDRYGRRKALLSSFVINIVLMLILPYSPNYWVFIALRFLVGVGSGGTLNVGAVYTFEIVGPQYREFAGAVSLIPDGLSEASLVAFAYYSSNWRTFSMGYAVASLSFIILLILLPESPRWLVSKGQIDNAVEVLTRIAKFNKRDVTRIQYNVKFEVGDVTAKIIRKPSYLDFLKSKYKTFAVTVIWTATGSCYFGINQYITILGDDLLTTVSILGLMQIPSCLIAFAVNKLTTRKTGTLLSLFVTGISMIILAFLPRDHWAYIYLGAVACAACVGLFYVIYIFTGEMFPTSTRNMAYGIGSGGAKIGSMIVPFIVTLTPYWIPSLIFAVIVFTASVFCCFLPETKGIKLKDNA